MANDNLKNYPQSDKIKLSPGCGWLKTMLANSNRKPSFGVTNQILNNSNSYPL